MQVHWRHTLFVEIVLVLPLDRAHMQHMAPKLSLCEWNVLELGVGVDAGAVVEAHHLPALILGFFCGKKTSSVLFPPPTSKTPHALICSVSLTMR